MRLLSSETQLTREDCTCSPALSSQCHQGALEELRARTTLSRTVAPGRRKATSATRITDFVLTANQTQL